MIYKAITSLLLLAICNQLTYAQKADSLGSQEDIQTEKTEKWNYSIMGQFWLRQTQLNEGSLVGGKPVEQMTDASLRRVRLYASGPISDRIYISAAIGQNNLNTVNKEASLKLLDLQVEYQLAKNFYAGAGKSGFTGPSRYASPSSTRILATDLPLVALTTVNITDDLLRKYSAYLRGDIGRFRHRSVLTRPNTLSEVPISDRSSFAPGYPEWQFSGYYQYQFLTREKARSPYHAGTHLGKDKYLTLGAGFLFQDDAMWVLDEADTTMQKLQAFSTDLFAELPIRKSRAGRQWLTAYAGMLWNDYGTDYLRMVGANQMADGYRGGLLNGRGNSFPMMGTGQTLIFQLGYLIPFQWRKEDTYLLQLFYSAQYSQFEALDEPVVYHDTGLSLYLNNRYSRFTLGYQNRPAFIQDGVNGEISSFVTARNYQIVLQYQFYFSGTL